MSNSDYIVVYFGGSMHGKIECSAFCGDRREVRTRSGTEIYYYTRTQRVGDYDVLVAECEPFAPDYNPPPNATAEEVKTAFIEACRAKSRKHPWHTTPQPGEGVTGTTELPKPAQEPALPANAIVFVLCDDGIPDGWERAGMTLYDASYKPAIGSYKTLIGIRRKKVGDG